MVLKERKVYIDVLKSWLATLTIASNEDGIIVVSFSSPRKVSNELSRRGFTIYRSSSSELLQEAKGQITEYLLGRRGRFNLPLHLQGSDFQLNVWKETMRIPYGETVSYSELASIIGHPLACRAVGLALASNPTVILVPCHRVIRKNGEIGGFSGKVSIKRKLLTLEKHGRPLINNS